MARSTERTFCRNCGSCCGLVLQLEDDRIAEVTPDRTHPLTRGYMCIKGVMSGEWHNAKDRLTEIHAGDRRGGLRPIGADDALTSIAARLDALLERHGPRSVGLYFGTGVKFNALGSMALRSWLSAIGSPYLYSSSTIDQSAKWVTAGRMGVFEPGKHVIHEIDLMLVVGANAPVSHSGQPLAPFSSTRPLAAIREAKARGAKLIVVDPRRTEMAREADLHLQVMPGEDASVVAAMLNVILSEGLEDRAFCERFTTSSDRLRMAVKPFTPQYAAERADIPAEDIVAAARMFAQARRRSAWTGVGPNMSLRSNLAEHLVEDLNAVCGTYRRAGDRIRNIGALTPKGDVFETARPPNRTWEQEPKLWTRDTGLVGGEFPTSRIPDEILEGGLKALVVVGGNLATALGQPEKTVKALGALDLLVTLDPRATETALLSDFVIPTKMPYERYDATYLFDAFFVETFAQVARPVVSSPPGVLDDWEVFWELSKRMGKSLTLGAYKPGGSAGADADIRVDMDTKPTSEALIRLICDRGRIPTDVLFETPEGVLADVEPATIRTCADDGSRLDVCPPDVAEELSAVLADLPQPAEFPFRLSVRRMRETMNSAFREGAETQRRWPNSPVFMNPGDMSDLELMEGDEVEIVGEAGSTSGVALPDPTVRPKVISSPHQWGRGSGVAPDRLPVAYTGRLVSLDRDLETINYMPRQSGFPVRVVRRRGGT